jgi:hypothetical protein
MELAHPPSQLSGSQSSLASETGVGSADLLGSTLTRPEPKGSGECHAIPPISPAPPLPHTHSSKTAQ